MNGVGVRDEFEMIKELLNEFDFEKAHKVMTSLNWKWGFTGDVPTLFEIKKEVTRRLHDFVNELNGKKKADTDWYTSSGGFKVSGAKKKNKIEYIELEFVAVDSMSYLSK